MNGTGCDHGSTYFVVYARADTNPECPCICKVSRFHRDDSKEGTTAIQSVRAVKSCRIWSRFRRDNPQKDSKNGTTAIQSVHTMSVRFVLVSSFPSNGLLPPVIPGVHFYLVSDDSVLFWVTMHYLDILCLLRHCRMWSRFRRDDPQKLSPSLFLFFITGDSALVSGVSALITGDSAL